MLGASELGADWELGPSDRFARYAFDVTVGMALIDTQRRQLRAVVDYVRPARLLTKPLRREPALREDVVLMEA